MKQARTVTIGAALFLIFLALNACTTTSGTTGTVPDWVTDRPAGNDEYAYFVGSASSTSGDVAAAENDATAKLLEEITRYMGVTVETATTAQARATLDEYQTQVTQQVTQTGRARVAGFQVEDRYVQKDGDRVTVFLLVRYEKSALEAEKSRLEALFQERRAAVSVPENQAAAFERQGEYVAAARKFIEAAAAAARSDLENKDIKFRSNLDKARNALDRVVLEKLTDNIEAVIRQPFSQDFVLQVKSSGNGRPISGAQVTISYKELRDNGRMGVRTEVRSTDERGVLRYKHAPARFVGNETVTMALDFSDSLQLLEDLPRSYRPAVDSMTNAVVEKRVMFRYNVTSTARNVPTGVVILETDIAGNPTGSSNTQSAILERLVDSQFTVQQLPFDPERLKGLSPSDALSLFRSTFSANVNRVVYGIVAIDEFEEGDGVFVRVTGSVKAVDLQSGEVLYSSSLFQRSRGNSAASAISAAFRSIGTKFGDDLVNKLP